ncbi:hypothetical protein CDEST_15529 [Colletotrichum destructivum]|uniref:Uncharacterized protein n=1 Tax=Colletotrichum destructivum TaxID=34406 RepID=A0AAX4J565_9PEZI|nr:hypothetical protein CDEST_15529 [Colletotrichum destructivum]
MNTKRHYCQHHNSHHANALSDYSLRILFDRNWRDGGCEVLSSSQRQSGLETANHYKNLKSVGRICSVRAQAQEKEGIQSRGGTKIERTKVYHWVDYVESDELIGWKCSSSTKNVDILSRRPADGSKPLVPGRLI